MVFSSITDSDNQGKVPNGSISGSETGHGRFTQVEILNLKKNGQFPDDPVRIKVSQIHYVNSQTY